MTLTDTEEEGGATYDRAGDARVQATAPGPLEDLPIVIADADERIALAAMWNEQPPEPRLIDPEDTGTGELPVLPFEPESSDAMESSECPARSPKSQVAKESVPSESSSPPRTVRVVRPSR